MTPETIKELKATYSFAETFVGSLNSETRSHFGYSDPWNMYFKSYQIMLDDIVNALYDLLPDCQESVSILDHLKAFQNELNYRAKYVADHERTVVAITEECPLSTREIAESVCEALNEGTDAASSCQ